MKSTFFPIRPLVDPKIYVYQLLDVPSHKGWLKIGFTDRDAKTRIKEQLGTAALKYKILLEESSMLKNGNSFTDHDIHKRLRIKGIENPEGEWFICNLATIKSVILEIKTGKQLDELSRYLNFPMRPEQEAAVVKTINYFNSFRNEDFKQTPHFLWNAKMRFGKTFASYQLARKMNWNKILVLTFKPAVEDSWRSDLMTHVDFQGWQFISKNDSLDINFEFPIVCFGSFQDYMGRDKKTGAIKLKNEWVHEFNWDLVILMNIILEHGEIMRKNYSMVKTLMQMKKPNPRKA
ncbi:MAG: GIY-YIG nuclease family protein [Candidatus Caenarcaniphilales bacterium]|nr:GIY-YIG nuclease family protein [Candidatus Caenarcaniphilales bacterium]